MAGVLVCLVLIVALLSTLVVLTAARASSWLTSR